MKLLKKIMALLCCVILLTVHFTALAQDDSTAIYGTFFFKLHYNKLFAKYGATVYIDDTEVCHLEQGDQVTFGACMLQGRTYTVRIVPDKAKASACSWVFQSLQDGVVVQCELQSHRKRIEFKSSSLGYNGAVLVSISPDLKSKLEVAGFLVDTALKGVTTAYQINH